MFQTLRTFKTSFLSVLSKPLYDLLKDCNINKKEIRETMEESNFLNKEEIEEYLFTLIDESSIVTIECCIELEMILKDKYLEELERACLIFYCNGLEFININSNNINKSITNTLQKILENS